MKDLPAVVIIERGTPHGRATAAALRAYAPAAQVHPAGDAATASSPAEAVLLALDSPSCITELARTVAQSRLPVIAILDATSEDLAEAALEAGARECLIAGRASAAMMWRTIAGVVTLARTEATLERSRERLQVAARAADVLVWEYDFERNSCAYSVHVPQSLRSAMPLPSTEEEWTAWVHPDDMPEVLDSYRAVREGRSEDFRMDYRVRLADGRYAVVRDAASLVRHADGTATRMCGVLSDVTQQVESTTALQISEARLRLITDTVPSVFYLARTRPLRMSYLSPAFSSIWGIPEEDLYDPETRRLGVDVLERFIGTVHPDDRGRVRADISRRVRGEEVYSEYRIVRTDGELRWIGDRSYPLFGASGDVEQIVGLAEDITLRRQAAEELRQSEEQLTRILETISDALVILDGEARMTFANRAIEEIAGVPRSEIIGRSLLDPMWRFVTADGAPVPLETLPAMHALATGEPVYGSELRFVRPDGREVVLSVNVVPLRGAGSGRELIASIRDVTQERHAADRLRFQASLLDAVGEAVAATDLAGRVTYWNRQSERYTGWSAQEVEGRSILEVAAEPETRDQLVNVLIDVASGRRYAGEHRILRRDGTTFPAAITGTPILSESGAVIGIVAASRDLSDMKRLEEQLQQAQRMEAVGRLAGGVAHDFNNILTSIKGFTHFMLEELRESDPLRADAEEIAHSADRAAGLTRQLLAFSRRQVLQPRLLDLGAVVGRMERMLLRLIGEDVELVYTCGSNLPRVLADPGQIEQVVLNLAVNARDAMPSGGRLHIEIEDDCQLDATTGDGWVVLRVSDTGVGIAPGALPYIFEPFFTTKATGQGTGLGLSTVYGIVTQSGGTVRVHSRQGSGTVFEVRLPRARGVVEEPAARPAAPPSAAGETILLVEDEDSVRSLAARTLRRAGYTVIESCNGGEALLLCERHEGVIDLLLTDVVMPRMSGREVAERLTRMRPDMLVLFMSGYTADVIARHGILEEGQLFLEKPFTPAGLSARVREVLDCRGATGVSRPPAPVLPQALM